MPAWTESQDYYSDEQVVTELLSNVLSTTTPARIRIYRRLADTEIDNMLGGIFQDWHEVKGSGAIPDQIVMAASYLAAGRLEMTKFAVNEAGRSEPSPYGVSLVQNALQILQSIKDGNSVVPGLTRYGPVQSSSSTGSFQPVGGFGTAPFDPWREREE